MGGVVASVHLEDGPVFDLAQPHAEMLGHRPPAISVLTSQAVFPEFHAVGPHGQHAAQLLHEAEVALEALDRSGVYVPKLVKRADEVEEERAGRARFGAEAEHLARGRDAPGEIDLSPYLGLRAAGQ